jgi:hypothetical protein
VPEKFPDFAFQLGKGDRQRRAAGIDDNGPLLTQFIEVQTHGFAEAAFNTIAQYGASERTWSGEADAGACGARLRERERGKVSA